MRFHLLLFAIALSHVNFAIGQENHNWNQPTCVLSRNSNYILDNVEFQPSSTIMSFHTIDTPIDEWYVDKDVHLVDSKGNIYNLVKTNGIQHGSLTEIPTPGKLEFSLFFEPLPVDETIFDIMDSNTGRLEKFGIHARENIIKYCPTPKTDEGNWGIWKEDTVTIKGKIMDYSPYDGARLVATNYRPIVRSPYEIINQHGWIRNDGSFVLRYLADRSTLSFIYGLGEIIPYYAVPGDTIYMEIKYNKGKNHLVNISSSHGYDLHTSLLKAIYVPQYYDNLIDGKRKTMAASELFSELDSLENAWKDLNSYLTYKYKLTNWEESFLNEHTSLQFDNYRIHLIAAHEHDKESLLSKTYPEGMPLDTIQKVDIKDYGILRNINIDKPIRYMTLYSLHNQLISQILSLNMFKYGVDNTTSAHFSQLFPKQDCTLALRMAQSILMDKQTPMDAVYKNVKSPHFITERFKGKYVNLVPVFINNSYNIENVKKIARTEDYFKRNKLVKFVYLLNKDYIGNPIVHRLLSGDLNGRKIYIVDDYEFAQIVESLNLTEAGHVTFNKEGKLRLHAIQCDCVENMERALQEL